MTPANITYGSPSYMPWVILSGNIMEGKLTDEPRCPDCGQETIGTLYAMSTAEPPASLYVWCNACLKGVVVHGVIVPPAVTALYSESTLELRAAGMPKFRLLAMIDTPLAIRSTPLPKPIR